MPKVALSDIAIRNLPVPDKGQRDTWDASFPAFGVRVSQGGSKTFILNIYNSRRSIGRYGVISLAEARAEAKRILAEKTLGKGRPQTISYQEALRLFLDEKQKIRRANTHKNLKQRLTAHFPFTGKLADVSHVELNRRLSRIPSVTEQGHALSVAKTFFTWCHNRRLIDDNPTRGLSPQKQISRSRVLTDDELKFIWMACSRDAATRKDAVSTPSDVVSLHVPRAFATIVKLLILTGMRRSECAALQTSWIKDNTITLPKELTKNGREHTFPIGQTCASILERSLSSLGREKSQKHLFPASAHSSEKTPVFSAWSKSKAALDKLSGVTDWTLHDLRRTFATIHARIGTPVHVTEKLLNHVSGTHGGIVGIYQRHTYFPEMTAAMEAYEKYLLSIVE